MKPLNNTTSSGMIPNQNIDLLYQQIGEFVVSFQWYEHKFREIGWLINDPERKHCPPLILRRETNKDLLNKVLEMYCEAMDQIPFPEASEKKKSFIVLVDKSHEVRKYRNTMLHSAYVELKAGREVIGMMRSNPILKVGDDGDFLLDIE